MRSDLSLEHPVITALLRGGYTEPPEGPCCGCGAEFEQGKTIYEIEGKDVCEECFREWVQDYALTNPREVARALNVDFRLLQAG